MSAAQSTKTVVTRTKSKIKDRIKIFLVFNYLEILRH